MEGNKTATVYCARSRKKQEILQKKERRKI